MDPVGPWSAPYNRLTGVQTGSANSELHHHLPFSGSGATPPTTTAQLLPGGFLSPPPVGYETVFSPLFHHTGTKPPAHYAAQVSAQHRQVLAQATSASKQASDGEYHQPQAFFEQGAAGSGTWQQNSPFGILPHESVVNTTASKTVTYENFNAHFVAAQNLNHLNTLVTSNAKNLQRAQSPQVSKPPTSQPNTNTFFQVPISFTSSETNTNNTKSFSSSNSSNLQQSCIVSSPSNTPTSKEYRIPQAPPRAAFLNSTNATRPEKTYTTSNVKQVSQAQSPQIQTKAQTKIYPDLGSQSERRPSQSEENQQTQSSPISFSALDSPGRMNYASNSSSAKRSQFQQHSNYRQFQSGNNPESEFQRAKSGSDYNSSNGPDCNVVVPRRPSPLQAHSQASPLGHAPSPAYPMYNSPMNSISSPQQNTNSQVTPPSPLDASVPRPNSQQGGSVAYPSVITRALNSEKNFPERFDRPNQNNQQNCWEDRQQAQQRKFQSNPPVNNYSAANSMDVSNRESQQRTVVLTERQQAYFDSNNTVTLQDLSSCRGDPMTIVKNLQQQSCQIPQQEIKQEVKPPNKRRRSNDKLSSMSPTETPVPTVTEYFPGRIPPPAHSSAANQQQQQNGAYFDFDRWNLPPPASKIFGTQAAAIHQQHQGIMVPHPHSHHPPPPPLPYFPPFHLPPHPTEFASSSSSVELTPIPGSFNDQSSQASSSSAQYSQQEDQPKVVVPNIEEELNFLAEGGSAKPATNIYTRPNPTPSTASTIKSEKLSAPGADFMSSYLKFLQGEKDGSPPPTSRSSRKQTWPRIKAPQTGETSQQQQQQQQPQLLKPKPENNGITPNTITQVSGTVPSSSSTLPSIIPAPQITRLSSQGDPQDDPRYFPLPKERKKNMFESSDDGLSSDDDLFPKKTPVVTKQDTTKEKPTKKQKPSKTTNGEKPVSEKKKYRKNSKEGQHGKYEKDRDGERTKVKEEPIVRRETSKRAAKEKSNYKMLAKQAEEDEDAPDFVDSDSDPAWTPQAKEEVEEEAAPKKRRGRKKGSKNFHTTVSKDSDEHVNDTVHVKSKKQRAAGNKHKSSAPTLEDNIAAAVAQQNSIVSDSSSSTDGEGLPFKQGEFVVIKSERNQEWPGIWRVDGKNLLQKYEPFVQNGLTLYKNISTYTSWTPESKKQYVPVEVNVRSQNHLETIVQLARKDVHNLDPDFMAKCIQDSETYQDNFEVYIQTLISQALDSNFLTEIFQEQDDYFLSNVKTIDDITESKQKKLTHLLNWPKTVHGAVTTWPCFNVIRDINSSDKVKLCAACDSSTVNSRVLMYGQPYNSTTLEGCQPDPQAVNNKDFFMCRWCTSCVDLLNKISHQKYLMYIECAKRVADKRSSDPQKDTTCILNELLADESWLNTLFTKVRQTWAQADCIEHCYGDKKGTKV